MMASLQPMLLVVSVFLVIGGQVLMVNGIESFNVKTSRLFRRSVNDDKIVLNKNETDISMEYVTKLFDRYNDPSPVTVETLKKLLKTIGLGELLGQNKQTGDHNCSSLDGVLTQYGFQNQDSLDSTQFWQLSTAFLYYLDSGVCTHHSTSDKEDGRNMALIWLYMMLLVTLISLCAVWGILFIPRKSRSGYMKAIQFLIALAAGTMAGDGLLHLLPHAMMPEHDDHDDHGHDDHHDEDHEAEHVNALLKGLMAVIGVYAFFFLERGFAIYKEVKENAERKKNKNSMLMPTREGEVEGHGHSHMMFPGDVLDHEAPIRKDKENRKWYCPKLTPLALMIILGDLFHNFCDGLAIGAAFSASTTIGLSTSIAVFTHELPHEIGDFAVLIQSGLTKKEAVALNFLSALSCYIGAVIGIFMGEVGNAPMWIFAGVGGMFLYISLVDLVPEMTRIYVTNPTEWKIYLLLHAAGLFAGALLMFIIGLYEHDIANILD